MKKPKGMKFTKTWEKLKQDETDIDLVDLGRRLSRMDNPLANLRKQLRDLGKRILGI